MRRGIQAGGEGATQTCHVSRALQAGIPVTAQNVKPDVCIIELGGTVGDIESMPFIEAGHHRNQWGATATCVPCVAPWDSSVGEHAVVAATLRMCVLGAHHTHRLPHCTFCVHRHYAS